MQVHAFRGTGRVFGFTQDTTGSNLPTQYGPCTPFKTRELSRVDECLDDIEQHGIHLTEAHDRITDQVL